MNKLLLRTTHSLAALLISVLLAACGDSDDIQAISAQETKLYVFGDSLSDTGNLGRPLSFGSDLPPPFFENRISNGLVIVDYVARSLATAVEPSNYLTLEEDGTNYAIAGAKASSEPPDIDLGRQIDSFEQNNPTPIDQQNIFLVFIGGNDILDSLGTDDASSKIVQAVDAIGEGLNRLYTLGARRFVILNVPDIGATPKVLTESNPANGPMLASELSRLFNERLAGKVNELMNRTPDVQLVDIYGFLNEILASPGDFGFENSTQPCYNSADFEFSDFCNAEELDKFVFFDDIHPSARTHQIIGEKVASSIR